MSEAKRDITTIIEQDEQQAVNQQRSKPTSRSSSTLTNCKSVLFSHSNSFPGSSIRETASSQVKDRSAGQEESTVRHHHQSGHNCRHLCSRDKNVHRVNRLSTSKSTPNSFDYTLIDQDEYFFESNIIETPRSKCNSITLLIVMILIYYSILFALLLNYHSSLVARGKAIEEENNVSSNAFNVSEHFDALESLTNVNTEDDQSNRYVSDVDSSSLSHRQQSQVLTERGTERLINVASESLAKAGKESVVRLTDSSSRDETVSILERGAAEYFDISLDGDDDRIHLHWHPDYKRQRVLFHIHFTMVTPGEWFAFGFSNDGNITRADLCILSIDHKNQFHFQHVWTDEEAFIIADADDFKGCQFEKLTQSSPSDFDLWFTRDFDTCDPRNYVIKDGTTHLVYATGRGTVKRVENIKLLHPSPPQLATKYGFVRTRLLRPLEYISLSIVSHSDDSVQKVDIVANSTLVPSKETTYWCSIHKLPIDLASSKHHIIGYEAVITSKSLVHHMEVFHCEVDAAVPLQQKSDECHLMKQNGFEKCSKVIAAWAMGAGPLFYPVEAGLPIGGSSYSPYVMLEIHYNNPTELSSIVDSSGIRLYVSSHVRPHDIGIMELGLEYVDKNSIPPRQRSFTLSGYCVGECTRIALPSAGINIIASQLHTHLTGTRVVTRHIRNGVELDEVNRDDHYSQHFQEIRLLHKPVQVLPGDSLITTCTYDTRERSNMTLGGFAISQEMCVNYLHYYPKVQLEVCKSSIDDRFLQMFFRYMKQFEDADTDVTAKGYSDNFNSIHWSVNNVNKLHSLYSNSPLSMQCNKSDGERFQGDWNAVSVTKIYEKRKHHLNHCNTL